MRDGLRVSVTGGDAQARAALTLALHDALLRHGLTVEHNVPKETAENLDYFLDRRLRMLVGKVSVDGQGINKVAKIVLRKDDKPSKAAKPKAAAKSSRRKD